MHGGQGKDILIGGLEAGTTNPKEDIMFGMAVMTSVSGRRR